VEIEPVTPERWADFAHLFERKGPRGGTPMTAGCWCAWWRHRTGDPAKNKRNMRARVKAGDEPGLIAYQDGRAVGWVSVAPREQYGQLVRSRVYGPKEEEDGVWSIVCFYVEPPAKKQGIAAALAEAAVEHAFARGAAASRGLRARPGRLHGRSEIYERLGFGAVRAAGKRTVMRRVP